MSEQMPPVPEATLQQGPPILGYQNPNEGHGMCWREGMKLGALDGAVLPLRCVKCNGTDGVEMRRRKFVWYPRWTMLLILVNVLIFFIVALILRKKLTIHFGLCQKHRLKHRRMKQIAAVVLVAAIAFWWAAISAQSGALAIVAAVITLADLIFMTTVPVLKVQKIITGRGWLSGASPEFLADLMTAEQAPPALP